MTSHTRLFNNISILIVLVLPTLILVGYGLVLLTSYFSALMISVNEWWLYLVFILLGVMVVPLPPFHRKCATSLYKFYATFVQGLFSKNTQVFVIQDKVDLNSCQETEFENSAIDLLVSLPQTHANDEPAFYDCELLPSASSNRPPDLDHLTSTFESKFFFFKSVLAGCLFGIHRFLRSSFGMLSRVGGKIVQLGILKKLIIRFLGDKR